MSSSACPPSGRIGAACARPRRETAPEDGPESETRLRIARQLEAPKGRNVKAQGSALGERTVRKPSPEGAAEDRVPQSLANILIHIVFSTRNRAALISPAVAPDLYRYLASVSNAHNCPAHTVGGTENHLHICCSLARTQTCAKLVEEIKTGSSKWMKTNALPVAGFAWQNGYGVFSVGEDQLPPLKKYIEGQPEHHAQATFEEEFRELLGRYRVPYDERYVWD